MRRVLFALLAWMLLLTAGADAAKLPVYRDPPSYKGRTKAPPTKPPPAPTPPPAANLSATGNKPDVLVDEAGTAHIVWTEGNGDAADTVSYCRLKRGATTCDNNGGQPRSLIWDKPYGTGDGPQYNIDNFGPRIVRVGNQLVVFSVRYPTVADKPDGASSHTVIEWASNDGGNSWTDNAVVVGKWNLGQMAVIGPEDDPSILNSGADPLCDAPGGGSGWCLEAYKSGQYAKDAANLSTGSNQGYAPGIALDETGRPLAMVDDLNGNAVIRRWTGQQPVTNPATWMPPATFPADQAAMTGGPSGAWLMSKTTFGSGPFSVRRLNIGGDGSVSPGTPADVSANFDDIFADLFEDPSGGLHAAWEQRSGDQPGVKLRSATAAGFGPMQHIIDGQVNGEIKVGAAGDGGGFVTLNHNVGSNGGGIVAVGFGNEAATGVPGLGDIPGGAGTNANVSCQKVDFGKFALRTPAGCLLEGSGKFSNLVVSTEELAINGLRIVPDPGSKLIVDPRALRIDTEGPVRVIVSNTGAEVVLFHGPLHTDLSKVVPGTNLFEFASQDFKANVLGFDVAGDIPVKLTKDGVLIPVDLKLPPGFGGFTGHADLIANAAGLQVDSINIHAGPIPLGALVLKTVDVNWKAGGDWNGHAELTVPASGTITADIFFADGKFVGASFDFPLTPPAVIGPFVYLLRVNGGFKVTPTQLKAGATIGAGAPINGTAPVTVNGTFTMTFPDVGPGSFLLQGRASIFFFSFASMALEYQTDGYAQFRGDADVTLGPLSVVAKAEGFVDEPTGKFGADINGKVQLCITIVKEICASAGADVAMSNAGFAACGEILGESAGLEFPWSDFDPIVFLNPFFAAKALVEHFEWPCSTATYKVPPPRPLGARVAAAGGQVVAIGAGLPTATIVAEGGSAAPSVTVTGPNGLKLVSGEAPSAKGAIATPRGIPATYIALKKPAAGDYTIVPNEGSADIVRVLTGDGYKPASVTAKLRGKRISYAIANGGNGQTVVFQEKGRFGTHLLGTVSNARGTLRFKPAAGPGGKRTVTAVIQHNGLVDKQVKIGSYTAPNPPKPGAVGALRSVHKVHKLTITWKAARGATSYVVKIQGSKGTRLARMVGTKARSLKLGAMRRDERFTVTVRGLSKTNRAGPVRSSKSR
ncbi:MAG: hypothetical protein QOH13_1594 [Thermoleophilaceae bacterium]|nr:hypothetical protein [Thermoleophilaceae bacterium]